jgi:hypothetical protein
MPRKQIPEPWASFLHDLDGTLEEEAEPLVGVGDFTDPDLAQPALFE